jgi:hypothetical protein
VDRYYQAWIDGKGDFNEEPLAPDFTFTGPVASFDSAEGYRAMVPGREHGVLDHRLGDEFSGCPDDLCGSLHVRDGQIVNGELIYDAQELRAVMAGGALIARGCLSSTCRRGRRPDLPVKQHRSEVASTSSDGEAAIDEDVVAVVVTAGSDPVGGAGLAADVDACGPEVSRAAGSPVQPTRRALQWTTSRRLSRSSELRHVA